MKNLVKMFFIIFCMVSFFWPPYCRAQETTDSAPIACITEWCDAKWPPSEGEDRTYGKNNCGDTCIKIQKIVEIEKVITKYKREDSSVIVTLSTDENGKPVMKASCPKTGMSKYDYKLYKAGFTQKSRKKGEFLHIYYEKEKP